MQPSLFFLLSSSLYTSACSTLEPSLCLPSVCFQCFFSRFFSQISPSISTYSYLLPCSRTLLHVNYCVDPFLHQWFMGTFAWARAKIGLVCRPLFSPAVNKVWVMTSWVQKRRWHMHSSLLVTPQCSHWLRGLMLLSWRSLSPLHSTRLQRVR